MKVTVIVGQWIGNLFYQFSKALEKTGNEVNYVFFENRRHSVLKSLYLHHITDVAAWIKDIDINYFNNKVFEEVTKNEPDWLFVMNETSLKTETIKAIKNATGCRLAVWIADNPFDSSRFVHLPVSLKYFDLILVSERSWIPQIEKVAPKSRIEKIISGGGFSPDLFFPDTTLINDKANRFSCNIAFTGESYNMKAEGAYRAQILEYIAHYGLKFWGDAGWKMRFRQYPALEKCYMGGRLPYSELRKLYSSCLIYLNMPAPQIITGFQPRVYEIAACKGFQIVDWREELDELFSEDELVTFKSIQDLLEKADYFLKYPEKRVPFIEKMYIKVKNDFTWEKRAEEIDRLFHE